MSVMAPKYNPRGSWCGCRLPEGQIGQNGWHWKTWSLDDLLQNEIDRRAEQNQELADAIRAIRWQKQTQAQLDLVAEVSEAVEREHTPLAKRYVGQLAVVERCPAYQAKLEAGVRDDKRKAREGGDFREIV